MRDREGEGTGSRALNVTKGRWERQQGRDDERRWRRRGGEGVDTPIARRENTWNPTASSSSSPTLISALIPLPSGLGLAATKGKPMLHPWLRKGARTRGLGEASGAG